MRKHVEESVATGAAALVLVFAVLPGFIGDRVHAFFVGSDWREREWRTVLRIIAFSFTGALIYTLSASATDLEPPLHLFPSTFQSLTPESPALVQLSVASVGHVLGSVIAAVLVVGFAKVLSKYPPAKPGALVVSRSKRHDVTATRSLAPPKGGYSSNRSCSSRRSSRSCCWTYSRTTRSSCPTVET